MTLKCLATGSRYRTQSDEYRVGESTLSKILPATCDAIVESFQDRATQIPSTEAEWQAKSDTAFS